MKLKWTYTDLSKKIFYELLVYYAESFGDDFDTKTNEFKHIKWIPLNFDTLNTTVQELEMILSQKITNLNVPNGYSKYSYFSKA